MTCHNGEHEDNGHKDNNRQLLQRVHKFFVIAAVGYAHAVICGDVFEDYPFHGALHFGNGFAEHGLGFYVNRAPLIFAVYRNGGGSFFPFGKARQGDAFAVRIRNENAFQIAAFFAVFFVQRNQNVDFFAAGRIAARGLPVDVRFYFVRNAVDI